MGGPSVGVPTSLFYFYCKMLCNISKFFSFFPVPATLGVPLPTLSPPVPLPPHIFPGSRPPVPLNFLGRCLISSHSLPIGCILMGCPLVRGSLMIHSGVPLWGCPLVRGALTGDVHLRGSVPLVVVLLMVWCHKKLYFDSYLDHSGLFNATLLKVFQLSQSYFMNQLNVQDVNCLSADS